MADVNCISFAFNNTRKFPSLNIFKEIIKPWISIRVIIFQTLIKKNATNDMSQKMLSGINVRKRSFWLLLISFWSSLHQPFILSITKKKKKEREKWVKVLNQNEAVIENSV